VVDAGVVRRWTREWCGGGRGGGAVVDAGVVRRWTREWCGDGRGGGAVVNFFIVESCSDHSL
jgi:hypothetical protein